MLVLPDRHSCDLNPFLCDCFVHMQSIAYDMGIANRLHSAKMILRLRNVDPFLTNRELHQGTERMKDELLRVADKLGAPKWSGISTKDFATPELFRVETVSALMDALAEREPVAFLWQAHKGYRQEGMA